MVVTGFVGFPEPTAFLSNSFGDALGLRLRVAPSRPGVASASPVSIPNWAILAAPFRFMQMIAWSAAALMHFLANRCVGAAIFNFTKET